MTPLTREQVRALILSPQEAEDRLGISRDTLFSWRLKGRITPLLDSGNALIYFVDDVERIRSSPAHQARLKPNGRIRRGFPKKVAP
jgi:hypothetical protein